MTTHTITDADRAEQAAWFAQFRDQEELQALAPWYAAHPNAEREWRRFVTVATCAGLGLGLAFALAGAALHSWGLGLLGVGLLVLIVGAAVWQDAAQ